MCVGTKRGDIQAVVQLTYAMRKKSKKAAHNYAECGCYDPPVNKTKKTVLWIACDMCKYWYHIDCLSEKPDRRYTQWKCNRCISV